MRSKDRAPAPDSNRRLLIFGVSLFLFTIVFLVYGPALRFPFVNFDDDRYVYENTVVTHGLTSSGVASAFSTRGTDNWIPLTTLSHLLDCQLYGLKAGGHHLTNILLHAASAVLLFLALLRMTCALWRCALVAALFAIHPLGVESVAWISERKDVLSGFFFMLTLLAYAGYAHNPKSWAQYVASLFFAALGLMSKPMLVTLPFVLLLLDYWPLNRFELSASISKRLILEKIPFLVLSGAACLMTYSLQQSAGAVNALATIPMPLRIENALVSYARYTAKLLWPENLSVLYPLPGHWPMALVIFSTVLLLVLFIGVFVFRKKYPFVFTGWCWLVGMLVPVVGLIQVGSQAMADRYVYLPQIGFSIGIVWLVAELSIRLPQRLVVLTSLSLLVLLSLIYRASVQVSYWADSEKLWRHALASSSDEEWMQSNLCYAMAHNNLGSALLQKGEMDGAIVQFKDALTVDPDDAAAYYNLGNALLQNGKADEAIAQFQAVVKLDPKNAMAHYNQGNALLQAGQMEAASSQLQQALKLGLADANTFFNLGNGFLQAGRVDEAISWYQHALAIDSGNTAAHGNLANALLREGRVDEAITEYEVALKIQPDNAMFQNNLARIGWALATSPNAAMRSGSKARELAQRANELTGGTNPIILRVLAAANAEAGDFSQAVETGQQALALAEKAQNPSLVGALQREVALYQAKSPVRSDPTDMTGWQ